MWNFLFIVIFKIWGALGTLSHSYNSHILEEDMKGYVPSYRIITVTKKLRNEITILKNWTGYQSWWLYTLTASIAQLNRLREKNDNKTTKVWSHLKIITTLMICQCYKCYWYFYCLEGIGDLLVYTTLIRVMFII